MYHQSACIESAPVLVKIEQNEDELQLDNCPDTLQTGLKTPQIPHSQESEQLQERWQASCVEHHTKKKIKQYPWLTVIDGNYFCKVQLQLRFIQLRYNNCIEIVMLPYGEGEQNPYSR